MSRNTLSPLVISSVKPINVTKNKMGMFCYLFCVAYFVDVELLSFEFIEGQNK